MFLFNEKRSRFLYGAGQARLRIRKRKKQAILGSIGIVPPVALLAFSGLGVIRSLCLGGLLLAVLWILPEALLCQRSRDLRLLIKMDLPNFLDVLALLLEAGQPLWYAVTAASEMGDSEFCSRLEQTMHADTGMEENRNPELLLERFSEELGMPEVSSVIAAIVQNSRKGERELASVLRVQSAICRQERRTVAEELGNMASNVMLIPSGMVFTAILIMLMTPAVIQLSF